MFSFKCHLCFFPIVYDLDALCFQVIRQKRRPSKSHRYGRPACSMPTMMSRGESNSAFLFSKTNTSTDPCSEVQGCIDCLLFTGIRGIIKKRDFKSKEKKLFTQFSVIKFVFHFTRDSNSQTHTNILYYIC